MVLHTLYYLWVSRTSFVVDSMIRGHHAATGFSITELTFSLTLALVVEDEITLLLVH